MDKISTFLGHFLCKVKAENRDGIDPAQETLKIVYAILASMNHRLSIEFIDSPEEYDEMIKSWEKIAKDMADDFLKRKL